jgi:hypothetical protein
MPFRPPFVAQLNNYANILTIRIKLKSSVSALGQPLRMAAHASDWGNSLNQRCRGGEWNTMVMMFVGGVVLMLGRI